MKKRSLAVLMAGVMAASMMTGVVSVYADADSKTLTVGFDAQYPPFGYKDDNGEYVGFLTLTLHRKYATISDGSL